MKILLVDIETAPNIAYVWGLFKENIPLARLIESGYVLCWAAKWLGEDQIYFDSLGQSKERKMIERIHNLLDQADVVIHYYGTNFDIPTLNKEFIKLGLPPPSPFKQLDLLKTVKNQFKFPSNKLDYVSKALGIGQKVKHIGYELWTKCMHNDPEGWKQMEEYNIQDVILLEKLYLKIRPWIKNHPNIGIYLDEDKLVCPSCGSSRINKKGYAYTRTYKYQRFQCKDCRSWFRSNKNLGKKPQEYFNTI